MSEFKIEVKQRVYLSDNLPKAENYVVVYDDSGMSYELATLNDNPTALGIFLKILMTIPSEKHTVATTIDLITKLK